MGGCVFAAAACVLFALLYSFAAAVLSLSANKCNAAASETSKHNREATVIASLHASKHILIFVCVSVTGCSTVSLPRSQLPHALRSLSRYCQRVSV
jgi:hypothetical protein